MGKPLVNTVEWQFLVLLLSDVGNVRDHEGSVILFHFAASAYKVTWAISKILLT